MVFLCTLNTLQNTCLRSPSATSQSGATACRYAMLQQHLPQCSRGTTFANSNGCGAERITRPTTSGWSAAPAPPISADMAVGTISASRHRIVDLSLGVVVARPLSRNHTTAARENYLGTRYLLPLTCRQGSCSVFTLIAALPSQHSSLWITLS